MKHKNILLELIKADDVVAFGNWIKLHSELEQVEIMKEFKQMSLHNMFKSQNFSGAETIKKYTKSIETFEKTIHATIELKAILEKVQEVKGNALQRLARSSKENKQEIINSIINNDENATARKALAIQIIAIEKELGIYDADFWSPIL
ncbi:MAG: hypothetical protein H7239_04745 [Flavobacterium sp.]|nr:hypothetical protein [Flavobacterium sp.]